MESLASSASTLLAPWIDLYSSSVPIMTLVMFLHLGGLVICGGLAFALDRSILTAARVGRLDQDVARELDSGHVIVVGGLGLVLLSGLALAAADPETFLVSLTFWVKMAIIAALLMNGWLLKRAGEDLALAPEDSGIQHRLRGAAVRSLWLWGSAVLFGVLLTEAI